MRIQSPGRRCDREPVAAREWDPSSTGRRSCPRWRSVCELRRHVGNAIAGAKIASHSLRADFGLLARRRIAFRAMPDGDRLRQRVRHQRRKSTSSPSHRSRNVAMAVWLNRALAPASTPVPMKIPATGNSVVRSSRVTHVSTLVNFGNVATASRPCTSLDACRSPSGAQRPFTRCLPQLMRDL